MSTDDKNQGQSQNPDQVSTKIKFVPVGQPTVEDFVQELINSGEEEKRKMAESIEVARRFDD
jgi:hypothetical protein